MAFRVLNRNRVHIDLSAPDGTTVSVPPGLSSNLDDKFNIGEFPKGISAIREISAVSHTVSKEPPKYVDPEVDSSRVDNTDEGYSPRKTKAGK